MALINTLIDNFNDNSKDAQWNIGSAFCTLDTGVTVAEASGQLQITTRNYAGEAYRGYVSATTYDLTNNGAYVEVVQAASGSPVETAFYLGIDSDNLLRIVKANTLLYFQSRVDGSQTTHACVDYNAVAHLWWRIWHTTAGDTVYFDTSPDGVTWTNLASVARPFTITAVYAEVSAGAWDAKSASSAYFDNFNTSGAAPTTFSDVPPSIARRMAHLLAR